MKFAALVLAILAATPGMVRAAYEPSTITPPAPPREFRATWIATVHNLDWPSRPGLPMAAQCKELIAILDRAQALNLNAVILQIRPSCDAFYASPTDPWSYFLTGQMGQPPQPFYDPLEFAITAAHKRGLELHAWFNPFRALTSQDLAVSRTHVTKIHPEWVKRYGNYSWLDPGMEGPRKYARDIILDVVRRYDIDGVHIDDYFYPYPDKNKTEFPDYAVYKAYRDGGGTLSHEDWRRENINRFVKSLYEGIKAEKKWVKFGVSPFGIWRPNTPVGIKAGIDAYADLSADSLLWFKSGWLDYFSPQLYWPTDSPGQPFTKLIQWWASQNSLQRHLWPGIATERVGMDRNAAEIVRQVELTRQFSPASPGQIQWNFRALRDNKGGVASLLRSQAFLKPALIPDSPWLNVIRPVKPMVVPSSGAVASFSWSSLGTDPATGANQWVVQWKTGTGWDREFLPASRRSWAIQGQPPEVVSIAAVNRYGKIGTPSVWKKSAPLPAPR